GTPDALGFHHHRVWICERPLAPEDVDIVSVELALDDGALAPQNLAHAREERLRGGATFWRRAAHHVRALGGPRDREHRLAEGLARDRAGVDADAAQHAALLDDSCVTAEL